MWLVLVKSAPPSVAVNVVLVASAAVSVAVASAAAIVVASVAVVVASAAVSVAAASAAATVVASVATVVVTNHRIIHPTFNKGTFRCPFFVPVGLNRYPITLEGDAE